MNHLVVLSIFVFFSITQTTKAEVFCSEESSNGFSKCHQVNSISIATDPCPNDNKEAEENQILANQGISEPTPVTCNDDDLFKGLQKEDQPSRNELIKDYTKQCKKKAKQYKKAVFKKMLKEMKLGQAFQALLKKKKNIYSTKASSGKKQKVSADLSPEDMESMSQEDLNSYIMDKLNEKVPGLKDAVSKAKSETNNLSPGFHESETIPMNIVVQKNGRQACTVNVENAPLSKLLTPSLVNFAKEKMLRIALLMIVLI